MFPSHLDYLKSKDISWFNPCYGYVGFWTEMKKFQESQKVSFHDAWKHRGMKRAKEIYATSITAMGMRQSEGSFRPWWIAKPDQDPPDGVVGTVTETENGNLMNVREVEVVEHLDGELRDTLVNKLHEKYYEPNTILVCLMSSSSGLYDFEKLASILPDNLSLPHIFIVAHGGRIQKKTTLTAADILQTARKNSFVQLAPVFAFTEIEPSIVCSSENDTQLAWMKFEGRGKTVGLRPVHTDNPPRLF